MTISYDAVIERPQRWFISGLLPLGQLILLVGKSGVGKGTVLADWTARLTRGVMLPGGTTVPVGRVVMVGPEDDPETAVKPRLMAAPIPSIQPLCHSLARLVVTAPRPIHLRGMPPVISSSFTWQ